MSNKARVAAALKAVPGARGSIAPQSNGMGRISPIQAEMYMQNSYANTYGPFMPRPPQTFSDGAFSPMPPIQPVPVDNPPAGGQYPDPRWWQYTPGYNLPTQPGSEGLKLASFAQLKTLADRYSVARACIELRKAEICGLEWEVTLTKEASKAYQGDHHANRQAGEKIAKLTKFFSRPDPDFWSFESFLTAVLEEVFVFDAMSLIFRPKYGEKFGMGGRGLLGSNLDSLRLVSGPTIRPLVDMHGGHPTPPAPAYQQYLYGVPRSDYMTIMRGDDLDELEGSEYNEFTSDLMLYAPHWPVRESPYGFPPVERALVPIISGLQKQEYQLDYFTEGSVPAVYISPGDPNITPTQIKELQDALNGIAGDKAFHMKVVVLPPGAKVEPQRPVDLSDGFDQLVMTQVCMAFDITPMEIAIIPDVGGGGGQGPSASSIRFAGQESRDIKSRKSSKPLLKYLQNIFNYVIQDVCGQPDLEFQFEGLADDEDKQAITDLGVQQVQNAISSIDEIRDRLDQPPWGLPETSEPVVFTAQGPIPLSMAPQLIANMQNQQSGGQQSGGKKSNNGTQNTNSGQRTASTRNRPSQPTVRAGGQTKPNGSHPAPVSPHRESLTPAHSAAAGAIQSSTPRTGGTTSRSSVAGSRKKAIYSELDALKRHLRKDRNSIYTWEPRHVDTWILTKIAIDLEKGFLVDAAVDKAIIGYDFDDEVFWEPEVDKVVSDVDVDSEVKQEYIELEEPDDEPRYVKKAEQWPGWEHDLGVVGTYKQGLGKAFRVADGVSSDLRSQAAKGEMYVSGSTLRGLIADEVKDTFLDVLDPLWSEAWHLGYESAQSLVTGEEPDFTKSHSGEALDNFKDTHGQHWIDQITRTGLKNASSRSEVIARTEVARAMNAAAIQAYRDNGVTHKEIMLAPDDGCDQCKAASEEGVIPLDSIFPGGDLGGPFHPQCRCVPAPAGMDLIPPQSHIGKSENPKMVAFMAFRAKEKGHDVYLLQKRAQDMNNPGTWGLPGGTSHDGEDPLTAAVRETTEEIGDLPEYEVKRHILREDKNRAVHIFICNTSERFTPKMNGETPDETSGWGWFRKKEIGKLPLQPNFKQQWQQILKGQRTVVDENGQRFTVTDPGQQLYPAGARWPYPRRSDGAEDPHYGTAELPQPHNNDMFDGRNSQAPGEDETDEFPRRRTRNQGPKKIPGQGGRRYPDTSTGGAQAGVQNPGVRTGVPPSGEKAAMPVPVVGVRPPHAPKPMSPRSVPPVSFNPGNNVEAWNEEEGSDVVSPPPPKTKSAAEDAALADPNKPGGASDFNDPNPVDAEHIYDQMAKNFPPEAIEWVKRAKWVGPVWVPWNRVDTDDIESWAASHQPDKVNDFKKLIEAHDGHVAPSVLVQEPNSNKAFIVDGHHRALARKKLKQDVLAYIGNIDGRDRLKALETHSHQIHQGSDPRNA